ncbi:MAG TPA: glycine zipper family protein [Burkholderiales bacterium]|nr:glycine zipper family protein [Burkholderiales bacterium]
MRKTLFGAAALLVAGCTAIPGGPSVMVLPGSTKSFDQFRADDGECRQYAAAQVAGKDRANEGTTVQQRYDFAFQQCMYSRGHQIPLARGSMPRQPPRTTAATSPPPPPPPAGAPPPPPAGYRVN